MKTGPKIGYVRTSTEDQNDHLQRDALTHAGCELIFADAGVSGGSNPAQRPGFAQALEALTPGASLVVWKLDRLGRSLSAIIATIDELKTREVQLVSITDKIDTTSAQGRFFWQITAAFSELERGLIQERTREGLRAARARGKQLGRPPALSPEQRTHAAREIAAGRETLGGMAAILGVDRGTLRRALAR